jgi:hypothetical protein
MNRSRPATNPVLICLAAVLVLAGLLLSPLTPAAAQADLPPVPPHTPISSMGPPEVPGYPAAYPAAAYSPTAKRFLVAWAGDDNGSGQMRIYGQLLSIETGQPVGPDDFLIAEMPDDPQNDAVHPAVAWNNIRGQFAVVYSARDVSAANTNPQVYLQWVTTDGVPEGLPVALTSTYGAAPVIDCGQAGTCLVVWQNTSGAITGQRLDPSGALAGAAVNISNLAPGRGPRVAWNGTTSTFLVAWRESGSIALQRVDAAGTLIGAPASVSAPTGSVLDLAANPTTGETLLVWDAETSIQAVRINISGAPVGSPTSVSEPASAAVSWPSAGYSPVSGEYLVVWNQPSGSGGKYDMYGQRLSASLSQMPTAADIRLSWHGGSTNDNYWAVPPSSVACASAVYKACLVNWAATDSIPGQQAMDDLEIFALFFSENTAPVLQVVANQTIDELAALQITLSASDADIPPQSLTYTLTAKPDGMTINPTTGVISWTPSEAQGPGVYTVTARVIDNGSPALSHQRTFTLTVDEVNQAPRWRPSRTRLLTSWPRLPSTRLARTATCPPRL